MKVEVIFIDERSCIEKQIRNAVRDDNEALRKSGMSADEADVISEVQFQKLRDLIITYFPYGEVVSVELDTDTNSATVMKTAAHRLFEELETESRT